MQHAHSCDQQHGPFISWTYLSTWKNSCDLQISLPIAPGLLNRSRWLRCIQTGASTVNSVSMRAAVINLVSFWLMFYIQTFTKNNFEHYFLSLGTVSHPTQIYWPTTCLPFLTYLQNQWRYTRGLQRDVIYLCWPIAPSYSSPNAGEGVGCGVWASEYSCAHHVTWIYWIIPDQGEFG